jgi:hypothetical protein
MKKRQSSQIRLLIQKVLSPPGMYSQEAEDLIFGTGLIESGYKYLRQWNNGVARSWFQIEPDTAFDIIVNYLAYRDTLKQTCAKISMVDLKYFSQSVSKEDIQNLLESNISYAIIMCRLKYRRIPKKLPNTIKDMSLYWKKYYNTELGKGNPSEFVSKYNNDKEMA